MKIQAAKEIIKENYSLYQKEENLYYIENKKVIDSLYCLAEFSYKMIQNSYPSIRSLKEDIKQEMVIKCFKVLKDQSFTFGCIQNYMQTVGVNHIIRYDLKHIDTRKIIVPYDTVDASELEELFMEDKRDEYQKLLSLESHIKRITALAKRKLKENICTRESAKELLFPLLFCVYTQNYHLLKQFYPRMRFTLRKISYELEEELNNIKI